MIREKDKINVSKIKMTQPTSYKLSSALGRQQTKNTPTMPMNSLASLSSTRLRLALREATVPTGR